MKRLICAVLALMMTVGLCACGGEEIVVTGENEEIVVQPTADEVAATQSDSDEIVVDDGKVTYTIHVQDENGAPLAGVMVQICKDACLPGMTDAEGNATFTVAEDDYKASFLMLPAGYTYATEETEFYFDGATEITLVLKAE